MTETFTNVGSDAPVSDSHSAPVVDDSAATDSTAVPLEPTQEAKPTEPQRFKIKVSGEEKEVSYPELERAYQRLGGVDKRLAEAKAQEERINKALAFLEGNPMAKAVLAGQDPYQIAEALVYQRMQEERLPPEQRAAIQTQRRLAEMNRQIEEMETRKRELELDNQAAAYAAKYEPILADSLTKAGIPINSPLVEQVTQAMANYAREYGWESMDVGEIVEGVRKTFIDTVNKVFGTYPEDALLNFLSEETAAKVSKAYSKKLMARPKPVAPLPGSAVPTKEQKNYVTEKEFDDAMKRFRNG